MSAHVQDFEDTLSVRESYDYIICGIMAALEE